MDFQERISRLSIFFVAYTICFILFFSTLKYTIPFVLAAICAYILRYPTRFLIKKFKMKDWLASIITTVIFFGIITVVNIMLVSSLTAELIGITKYLQQLISNNSSEIYNFFTNTLNNISSIAIDPTISDAIRNNLASTATSLISTSISLGTTLIQALITIVSYVPYIGMVIAFTLLSTYFFTKRLAMSSSAKLLNKMPQSTNKIFKVFTHGKKMFSNYILSYMTIIFISFLTTFIGFLFFKVPYALVLSILSALLDLLPVVGMPLVYIPLSIMFFFQGNYFGSIGLVILYILVFLTRQIIEPKIMSSSLGLDPVAVLAAIFIGLELNGFGGMVFCMFLVVFYNILKKVEIL